jgi:hypothetical protein
MVRPRPRRSSRHRPFYGLAAWLGQHQRHPPQSPLGANLIQRVRLLPEVRHVATNDPSSRAIPTVALRSAASRAFASFIAHARITARGSVSGTVRESANNDNAASTGPVCGDGGAPACHAPRVEPIAGDEDDGLPGDVAWTADLVAVHHAAVVVVFGHACAFRLGLGARRRCGGLWSACGLQYTPGRVDDGLPGQRPSATLAVEFGGHDWAARSAAGLPTQ